MFIYLFLATLGLHCFVWAFSRCSELGLLFVAVFGLLTAVVSLVSEHSSRCTASVVAACGLSSFSSPAYSTSWVGVVHRLSCSVSCGIFPGQGSSQVRDQTPGSSIGRQIAIHSTTTAPISQIKKINNILA